MAYIDPATQTYHTKLVYWGPGLSGRGTSIRQVSRYYQSQGRFYEPALVYPTQEQFGHLHNKSLCFHLFHFGMSLWRDPIRMEGLKGVDGVVVVFDSQQARLEANLEALDELESTLSSQNAFLTPEMPAIQKQNRAIPWVAQLNKRELPTSLPQRSLVEALQLPPGLRIFESIATRAEGVLEAFREIASQVHVYLHSRSQIPSSGGF